MVPHYGFGDDGDRIRSLEQLKNGKYRRAFDRVFGRSQICLCKLASPMATQIPPGMATSNSPVGADRKLTHLEGLC